MFGTLALVAAALVVLYLAASPRIFERLWHPMLFHPHKEKGDRAVFARLAQTVPCQEKFFVNRAGNRLRVMLVGENDGSPVIMYSTGKDGDIERRAEILSLILDAGAAVFIYEYSGFGESSGRPSIKRIHEDALDAYDFLTGTLCVDPSRVVLYGESLGGSPSTYVLRRRRTGGIVLKSAFASLLQAAREKLFLMRLYPQWLFPSLDNAESLRFADGLPVLIIHGAGDRMLSMRHPQRLFDCASEPKTLVVLPDSRHSYMPDADKKTFQDALARFLQNVSNVAT